MSRSHDTLTFAVGQRRRAGAVIGRSSTPARGIGGGGGAGRGALCGGGGGGGGVGGGGGGGGGGAWGGGGGGGEGILPGKTWRNFSILFSHESHGMGSGFHRRSILEDHRRK